MHSQSAHKGLASLLSALSLSALALLLMGAVAATDSARRSSPVGVIDTGRITSESVTIQKAIAEVSTEAKKTKEEYEKKQAELGAATDRYNKQQSVATREENERRRGEIRRLEEDLEDTQIRLSRAIKKAQEKMVSPMGERISAALKEICAARGVSVVIGRESAVYYDPATDLTALVISKLDGR